MSSAKYLTDLSGSVYVNNNSGIISPTTVRSFNSRLIENTFPATYVIADQTDFDQWVNNNTANDYSYVFIKKGTYSSVKSIDLTAAKTIGIDCEPGTVIRVTFQASAATWFAIGYTDGMGETGARYCNNLTVTVLTSPEVDSNIIRGFYFMRGLTNCVVTGNNAFTGVRAGITGFIGCSDLCNCRADDLTSQGGSASEAFGFYTCRNLINCSAGVIRAPSTWGFYSCNRLTSCAVTGANGDNYTCAYYASTYCVQCSAAVAGSNGNVYGFNLCRKMYGCYSSVTSSSSGSRVAYYSCRVMFGCESTSTMPTGITYHFSSCRVMFGCGPAGGASYGTLYTACYMTATGTTYPVGETAAGGYNRSSVI